VDAGIICGPPKPGTPGPLIYTFGPDAPALGMLAQHGLRISDLHGPVGAASGLKMSYAGITKGLTALASAMMLAAMRFGTAPALLVTVAILHTAAETIERFEAAVRAKEWAVFAKLDHAAAAEAAGLQLRPCTVVVFGNPKGGTPAMRTNSTLAIVLPLKALVWEDDSGKVWLTYNSAEFVGQHVYGRHGLSLDAKPSQGLAKLLGDVSRDATQ